MIIDIVKLHVSPTIRKVRSLIMNSRITFIELIMKKTPKICIYDNQFLALKSCFI